MLKYLPNALTMSNLICGCIGIWYGVHGEITTAAYMVLGSAFFDFLDGFAARLTGYHSALGKDLDSLADVVSFGVSPTLMSFAFASQGEESLLQIVAKPELWPIFLLFLLPVASAYRLAVFNHDQSQSHVFKGLPTPANGIFWAFYALGLSQNAWGDFLAQPVVVGAIALLFSWLMISRISLLSLKGVNKSIQSLLPLIAIATVGVLMVFLYGIAGLAPAVVGYLLISVMVCRWIK